MLVSFPDCPVSITTYRKCFIFPYKPCIYSQPWHTWGKKKKKKAHTISELVGFFTLSGGISEKVFSANEQPVRNLTTGSAETFILILSTSRTGCGALLSFAAPCIFNSGSLFEMINFS